MIPRFVIRNVTPLFLQTITSKGYEVKDESLNYLREPTSVLILDKSILQAPGDDMKPLLKVFDAANPADWSFIDQQLDVQKTWTANMVQTELILGEPKKGKVIVTRLGLLIDSFIVPIDTLKNVINGYTKVDGVPIASHALTINETRPFFTIGCADYSLADLKEILSAHEKLVQPAS